MKKTFFYALLFASGMMLATSCVHEEDDIFDASAAERLNAASEKYTNILLGGEGGWLIEYYPTNEDAPTTGEGYHWLAKFNKDMSVNVGMNNYFSGNKYTEYSSSWEVITDNGPVLTFNSYNPNVHVFSDPDLRSIPGSDENVWGTGVGGDYEFVIVQAPSEESPFIMLKGKKRGTYNRMTPLPAGTDFAEYLADLATFKNNLFPANAVNENVMTIGGEKYYINSASTGILGVYPHDGDAITETSSHPFMISKRDEKYYFRFRTAFEANDTEEQEFVYDAENDRFVGVMNAENTIEGENPSLFLQTWFGMNAKWAMVTGTHPYEMSESFTPYYQDAASGVAKTGWTIQNVSFRLEGEDMVLDIAARNARRQTVTLSYLFSSQVAEDYTWEISYKEPIVTERNKTSETVLNNVPALLTFLQKLSGSLRASSTTTKFELSTLRLAYTDDSNSWFNVHTAY
ncbi:MAG: DUF4302 domain-containing protein [Prevotella sp.]|nr:DUF4302 domain-containing protein [Prevotella sp.]